MASTSTREPLAIRAAVTGAATAVLHLLVVLGVVPIDAEAEAAAVMAIDMLGMAAVVIWTRGKVTPVDDPKLEIPAGSGSRRLTEPEAPEVGGSETVSVSIPE